MMHFVWYHILEYNDGHHMKTNCIFKRSQKSQYIEIAKKPMYFRSRPNGKSSPATSFLKKHCECTRFSKHSLPLPSSCFCKYAVYRWVDVYQKIRAKIFKKQFLSTGLAVLFQIDWDKHCQILYPRGGGVKIGGIQCSEGVSAMLRKHNGAYGA